MRTLKKRTFTGTTDPAITAREIENRAVARKAAAEGMVLLKNEDHFLPLEKGTSLALYGIGACRTIKGGTGSGDVNERESVSIYQGLVDAGFTVTTKDWIDAYEKSYLDARNAWRDDILERAKALDPVLGFFNVYSTTPFHMPVGGEVRATDADTAIYVLSRIAGEGADRYAAGGDYLLSEKEEEMLGNICTLYKNVIVVLNTGGVVDLSFMDKYDNIKALLQIMQPGMEGGHAFADILLGEVTPSGKLTDTWAYHYEDYPSSEGFSHNNGNVEKEYYNDGIYVGYRYFDTFDVQVRYGFGFGLSYTDFSVCAGNAVFAAGEKPGFSMKVIVKNIGLTYAGKEVVQIYATCPANKMDKEYRRLVAFAKTGLLNPGEEETLELFVPIDALTSYDEQVPGWTLEKGEYVFWAGNSLASSRPVAAATLTQDVVLVKTEHVAVPKEAVEEIAPKAEQTTGNREALSEIVKTKGIPVVEIPADALKTTVVEYKKNSELTEKESRDFVDTLSEEELIALASGDPGKGQGSNLGSAGIAVPGSAGETNNCCLDKNLASIVLSDGPAGLRLNKFYNVEDGQIVSTPFQFSLEGGIFCPGLEDQLPGTRYYQYCTAIPVGTLLAQTWDVKLIREIGAMIGGEMQLFDTTLWLAPGMNIHRNPLCGRNFEYYSEDPFVSGKIAAAMTDGVQSVPGCGTTIKHFACNNQEDNRMGVDSILSERALREIYLKGFEIAIKEAQPMSIMTSYNLINGVHAANNYDTCTKAARCEWEFAGMIMTDWTTTEKGPDCTASGCMRAGNDLVMPGALSDRANLQEELADGRLPKEDLKACIARLVNIVWQSNMYEDAVPYKK